MYIILNDKEIYHKIISERDNNLIPEKEAQECIKQLYEGNFIEYLENGVIYVEFEDLIFNFDLSDNIKVYTPL